MIRYRVTHVTEYRYNASVSQCQNEAHLLPRSTPRQKCEHGQLRIQPAPAAYQDRKDFFGNHVTYFTIQESHVSLSVTARSEVLIAPVAPPPLRDSPTWEETRRSVSKDMSHAGIEARQFLLDSPLVHSSAALTAYATPSFTPDRPLLEAVADLVQRIYQEFTYEPEATTVSTPLGEVLDHRQGVCQDFCACGYRLSTHARHRRTLRQRLSRNRRLRRPASAHGGRGFSRLGIGVLSWAGLDRFRSHQQHHPHRPTYYCRLGPGL